MWRASYVTSVFFLVRLESAFRGNDVIQSSHHHSIDIDCGLLMKAFLYTVYILGAAHEIAAFVCTPQSLYVSNCRRGYHETYRVQRTNKLYATNDKNDVSDKLVEEETNFFAALKSALQEVWMLKDDEEVS